MTGVQTCALPISRTLNRSYFRWVESGRPFVTLKLALSLDGQVAAATGESRWISGETARRMVHRMRSEADAVLVGGVTFRRDAPLLSSRIPGGRNPKRVILTSKLDGWTRKGRFLAEGGEVIVATPRGASRKTAGRLQATGIRVLSLPAREGRIPAGDRKSTRLNSSHMSESRMPSSA